MHVAVNMVGVRRWCGVVLIMGHRHQWRHRPRLRLFSF